MDVSNMLSLLIWWTMCAITSGNSIKEPKVEVSWVKYFNDTDKLNVTVIPSSENQNENIEWSIRYRLHTGNSRPRNWDRYYGSLNKKCVRYQNPNMSCNKSLEFPCGCPEYIPGTNTCIFGHICFMSDRWHEFFVEGTSSGDKINTTKLIKVAAYIVKSPPIKAIDVKPNNRSATLQWEGTPSYKSVYRYRYQSQWDEPDKWTDFESIRSMVLVLEGLIPASRYTVEVQSKIPESIYWSTAKYIHLTTLEDVPGSGPLISDGAHVFGKGNRLFLYLQQVPDKQRNGNITGYEVGVYNSGGQTGNITYNWTLLTINTLVIDEITQHPDTVINIWARNNAGRSTKASTITITGEQQHDMLTPGDIIVERIHKSAVSVGWPSWQRSADQVLLHICKSALEKWGVVICQSNYDWISVNASASFVEYLLLDGVVGDYRFGLSVRTGKKSSGITWSAVCTYDQNAAPGRPTNIRKWNYTNSGLNIVWNKPVCDKPGGIVSNYTVSHSTSPSSADKQDCEQGKFDITDGPVSRITLPQVKEGGRYSICVRATSPRGAVGEWSKPIVAVAEITDNRSGEVSGYEDYAIVVTVVASVVALVGLSATMFWCYVRWKKTIEFLYEEPPSLPAVACSRDDKNAIGTGKSLGAVIKSPVVDIETGNDYFTMDRVPSQVAVSSDSVQHAEIAYIRNPRIGSSSDYLQFTESRFEDNSYVGQSANIYLLSNHSPYVNDVNRSVNRLSDVEMARIPSLAEQLSNTDMVLHSTDGTRSDGCIVSHRTQDSSLSGCSENNDSPTTADRGKHSGSTAVFDSWATNESPDQVNSYVNLAAEHHMDMINSDNGIRGHTNGDICNIRVESGHEVDDTIGSHSQFADEPNTEGASNVVYINQNECSPANSIIFDEKLNNEIARTDSVDTESEDTDLTNLAQNERDYVSGIEVTLGSISRCMSNEYTDVTSSVDYVRFVDNVNESILQSNSISTNLNTELRKEKETSHMDQIAINRCLLEPAMTRGNDKYGIDPGNADKDSVPDDVSTKNSAPLVGYSLFTMQPLVDNNCNFIHVGNPADANNNNSTDLH